MLLKIMLYSRELSFDSEELYFTRYHSWFHLQIKNSHEISHITQEECSTVNHPNLTLSMPGKKFRTWLFDIFFFTFLPRKQAFDISCKTSFFFFFFFFFGKIRKHQGPVVQSIISLTSSLVVKMITVLVSTIVCSQVFLLKKMSAKILAYNYAIFNDQSFNDAN